MLEARAKLKNVAKMEAKKTKPRKPAAKPGLNARQKLFALEYLKDRNGTQAALRAGYSAKSAQMHASRLLSNAMIRALIDAKAEKIAATLEVTAERIMAEYAKIAFSDLRKAMDWGGISAQAKDSEEIDDNTAAAIAEVSTTKDGIKIKMHSKTDALHKLGIELGMFKQGVKVSGDTDNPLVALVQSIQGTSLPLGHVQPDPAAAPPTAAPVTGWTQPEQPRSPDVPTISPLLRPQGD